MFKNLVYVVYKQYFVQRKFNKCSWITWENLNKRYYHFRNCTNFSNFVADNYWYISYALRLANAANPGVTGQSIPPSRLYPRPYYTPISPNSTCLVTSHLDTTRHVRRVESSRAVPTWRTENKLYSARRYKFSRFYALTYTNPIVPSN